MKKLIAVLAGIFLIEVILLVLVSTNKIDRRDQAPSPNASQKAVSAPVTPAEKNPFDEPPPVKPVELPKPPAAQLAPDNANVILDFEGKNDTYAVESQKHPVMSTEKFSRGAASLKIAQGDYLNIRTPKLAASKPGDLLRMDFYNDTPATQQIRVEIFDDKTDYWNRHVREYQLRPGWSTLSFPIQALPRGEKNSQRKQGLLDPAKIKRIDLVFDQQGEGFFYLDNVRFEPDKLMPTVAGLKAFDIGPESHTLRWGFVSSTNEPYNSIRGYGWKHTRANVRDYNHPNSLLGDFRDCWGDTFSVSLANGRWHVLVFFEEHGWWEDQFCNFKSRTILAQGKAVEEEVRGEKESFANFTRFADVEPTGATDVYDMYIRNGRYKPHEFDVDVDGERLDIGFEADRPMAARVSAIVLWPAESQAEGEAWLAELHARMKEQFDSEHPYIPYVNAKQPVKVEGLAVFTTGMNPAGPEYAPSKDEITESFNLIALPGEHTGFSFSLRSDKAENIVIKAQMEGGAEAQVFLVQNRIARVYGGYTILPDILCPLPENITLPANFTRQFWVEIPPAAKSAKGTITINRGGEEKILTINYTAMATALVKRSAPFEPTNMAYGLFGLGEDFYHAAGWPGNVIALLRQHGMTSVGGLKLGHAFVKGGEIRVDFTTADAIMAALKQNGFRLSVDTYGGGTVSGIEDVAQKLNLSKEEALRRVYDIVRQHAEEAMWLPFTISLVDEPQWSDEAVLAAAEGIQKFKQGVPWATLNGYWSPNANSSFHRRLMDALDRTTMSVFRKSTVDYLKANNKQVGMYGLADRTSFGIQQFSAYEAGFVSHYAWHFYIRYGDLYYDLDSREPDVCMVYYGPEGIRPSLKLKGVRAGAYDFKALVLLRRHAKLNPEASQLLDEARAAGNIYGAKGRIASPDEFRKKVYEALMRLTPAIPSDEVE